MAPNTPGKTSLKNNGLSMFLNRICDKPETPVVNTSAVCTAAVATLGSTPKCNNKVVQLTPYAMPKVPSIIWATKPTTMKRRKVLLTKKEDPFTVGNTVISRYVINI